MRTPRVAPAVLGGVLVAFAFGCGKARPVTDGTARCTTWKDDVAVVLADRCGSCHAGATPAGGYDVSTYLGTVGGRVGEAAHAVAGEPASHLLAMLDPDGPDATHAAFSDLLPLLRGWVVECKLAYFRSSIHGGGIINPASPEFHGQVVRSLDWKLDVCQKCHGTCPAPTADAPECTDFSGGKAARSCLACHTTGVTSSCTGCHGQPPPTGAHRRHVEGGPLGKAFDCSECHIKPHAWTDPGHVRQIDGTADPAPAEITFGALAGAAGSDRKGLPTWDRDGARCSNVYCHGAALGDASATNPEPQWTPVGTDQAKCGACHGLPPRSHGTVKAESCAMCHGAVVTVADGKPVIAHPDKHIDGKIALGDESGTCGACHFDPKAAGPFHDLGGSTDTNQVTVGAHTAHLRAGHLRGPLACQECHAVPGKPGDAGHVDTDLPAEVFPAGATPLARTDGATPVWDRAAATCSNVYCHGGGSKAATDAATGLLRTPVWTKVGAAQAGCGNCHGVPPVDKNHPPPMKLADCVRCHAKTVDAFGNVIRSGAPGAETSAHINGVVDVTP